MSQDATITAAELQNLLRRSKAAAERFVTNFFVAPSQWPTWIARGLRPVFADHRMVLLLWTEEGCARLFFAGDRSALASVLGDGTMLGRRPVAVDLIGRPTDARHLAAEFESSRFRMHLRLFRLSCAGPLQIDSEHPVSSTSVAAEAKDVAAIRQLLTVHFDAYADQLPAPVAVQEAIEGGEIRVIRRAEKVDGFVWYTQTGATALIRFWCVARNARGLGIGGQLMRDYFALHRECQRHVLWVRENNPVAAACYDHYGYKPDGLEDHVMVHEK